MISGNHELMLVEGNDILTNIPQRPPFVFIDKLLEAGDERVVGELKLLAGNILVSNGQYSEAGIIESIAQTIAAGAGFKMKQKLLDVKIGYIAAIRQLHIYKLPLAGETLVITVRLVNRILDITIAMAEVVSGGHKIAECEMRIFTREE
jgi:3-hydroxyacyl-[acyl-carrier-protein] dehydratase